MTKEELDRRVREIDDLVDEPRQMMAKAQQLYKDGANVGLYYMGLANQFCDQDQEAYQCYKKYTQLEPEDSNGWQFLGSMELLLDKEAEALPHLTKAWEMGNLNAADVLAGYMVNLGLALQIESEQNQDPSKFVEYNDAVLKQLTQGVDLFQLLATKDPTALSNSDWAVWQEGLGLLYRLALAGYTSFGDVVSLADEEHQKQIDNGQLPDAKNVVYKALLKAADRMDRAGRTADAAMLRCCIANETFRKTGSAREGLNAEWFWNYALQQAGAQMDDPAAWRENYSTLEKDLANQSRRQAKALQAARAQGEQPMLPTFYLDKAKIPPLEAWEGYAHYQATAQTSAPAAFAAAGGAGGQGLLEECKTILREGFPGIYLFTLGGALLFALGNSVILGAAGLVLALAGVRKSFRLYSDGHTRLVAGVLHLVLWALVVNLLG